jgi:hypothetical protein
MLDEDALRRLGRAAIGGALFVAGVLFGLVGSCWISR